MKFKEALLVLDNWQFVSVEFLTEKERTEKLYDGEVSAFSLKERIEDRLKSLAFLEVKKIEAKNNVLIIVLEQ